MNPGDRWGLPSRDQHRWPSPPKALLLRDRVNHQVRPPLRGDADGLSEPNCTYLPLSRAGKLCPE